MDTPVEDILNEYAMIKKGLAEVSEAFLKSKGSSWDSLKDMEEKIGTLGPGVYPALVGGGVQVEEKNVYLNGKSIGKKLKVRYSRHLNTNHNLVGML